ncbi:MAG TPA: hypothetical protein VGV15_09355, partial [Terriglobales bacterium]|nr:hypothetical protein [Terriglobales bacterium]
PLILAYRAHSSLLVDNFRNKYSCCAPGSTRDTSAVGIGIDSDNTVDPQFMLKARQSDGVSFDLWRHRPPDQQASSYDFCLMIDQLDPGDLKTVQRHPNLVFKKLAP